MELGIRGFLRSLITNLNSRFRNFELSDSIWWTKMRNWFDLDETQCSEVDDYEFENLCCRGVNLVAF